MTSKKKPAQRRTRKSPGQGEEAPSFEDALERLESLVERLEGGEISLEESLAAYTEGTGLVKQCMERLKKAEIVIRELHEDAEGFILEASPLAADAEDDDEDLEDEGQDEFRF